MRPSFLLSKGERKGMDGLILPEDILLHYAEVYCSRFQWEGTPKDMPQGFIERALFWTGGIAPVRAFGEEQLIASYPVMLGIYAQPISWRPVPAGGSIIPPNLMREYKQSKDPMMFCLPMAEQIRDLKRGASYTGDTQVSRSRRTRRGSTPRMRGLPPSASIPRR